MLRDFYCGEISEKHIGKKVKLAGWVAHWRDHGGVIFIDLRDRTGIVQLVFNPEVSSESHAVASRLGLEYVIAVEGVVRRRPEGTENPSIPTGYYEVVVDRIEVLNECDILPFPVEDRISLTEEVRLQFRYLDLRRPSVTSIFETRHRVLQECRRYLSENGFWEVETPFLTKSTPEGARDFLVPSRLQPGKFYALPQSPQLFKQILMVAGFDKYFQVVRCFRDEDLRADRQPEFTQIDIEASFVEERDIMNVVEGLIQHLFKNILRVELSLPFPVLSYQEAMLKFGTDTPDLRNPLVIVDVSDLAAESELSIFKKIIGEGGHVVCINLPGGATISRRQLDNMEDFARRIGAGGLAWIARKEGGDVSPIIKFFSASLLERLYSKTNCKKGDVLFFMAHQDPYPLMGQVRDELARRFLEIKKDDYRFVWITGFPLFELVEGRLDPVHHPFTSPVPEDVHLLDSEPLKVRARAYDIVLNGVEIGGGSIRIHKRELQEKIFELIGLERSVYQERFGFLLQALSYGAPPHGGIALGLDRLLMMMLGLNSIRDVIAFPKTQRGTCLLTGAPSGVDSEQLKELFIEVLAYEGKDSDNR